MKWDDFFKEMNLLLQGDGKFLDNFKKASWIKWRLCLGGIFLVTLSGKFQDCFKDSKETVREWKEYCYEKDWKIDGKLTGWCWEGFTLLTTKNFSRQTVNLDIPTETSKKSPDSNRNIVAFLYWRCFEERGFSILNYYFNAVANDKRWTCLPRGRFERTSSQ